MFGCARWGGAVWLALACLYALSIGRGFYSSDGEVMFQTTAALVERGTLDLAPDPGLPQIVPGSAGRAVSKYEPGLSLLMVPLYVAGDWLAGVNHAHRYRLAATAVLLLPALAAAGAVAVVGGLAARSGPPGAARMVVLAAGLASPLWWYGRVLFAEGLLALALTGAVACLLRAGRESGRSGAALAWAGLGGAVFGVGILTRAALAIYALPLAWLVAAGACAGWRDAIARLGAFGAGAVPFVAGLLVHNALRFDDPLRFGYAGEGFTTPPWEGAAGLLIAPGRGALIYAPPLLLSAALWPRLRRAHPALGWFLALAWAVALPFYGSWWAWGGGWSWGPRLLVPLLPLSCLPLSMLPAGCGWRGAALALIALGIAVQVSALLVDLTPGFAAAGGSVDWDPAQAPLTGAVRRLADGQTEPLALFHLGETGLPPTWSVGAPLALLAGMIAGVMGWLAGPQPGTRPARNQDQ